MSWEKHKLSRIRYLGDFALYLSLYIGVNTCKSTHCPSSCGISRQLKTFLIINLKFQYEYTFKLDFGI